MKRIITKMYLCLLAFCIAGGISAQTQNSMTEVIPFKTIDGKIIVEAAINGEVADFVLDLSGHNALLPEALKKLRIDTGKNGTFSAYQDFVFKQVPVGKVYEMATVAIGNNTFNNDLPAFTLEDEPYLRKLGVMGVLSGAIFRTSVLTIDMQRKKLTITQPYRPSYMKLNYRENFELDRYKEGMAMAGFSDIIGHEQIIGHLKNAIALDKVSHAYIFNGPKLSGKMMLAEAFAMALQCEGEGTRPCLLCRSCKQAVDHNQPDIIYVSHEKPNTIGVDDIRTQINNDIVIKPYSSRYKVYIVDEAEKMNQQAQNALLKTIEEPPAYAVILLLTTNADSFLPTILSRCITLNLKVVKEDVIKSYLMKTYHIPDYQADVCAAFSQGNVGKAIQLASSEEFGELKASVLQLMKRLEDIDLYEMTAAVKQIAEYKLTVNDYFDLMMIWFRDVLYMKATNDVNGLIFKDEVYDIKKQAAKRSYQGIETIIRALETAKVRISANVNFDLVIELLLLTIKEN